MTNRGFLSLNCIKPGTNCTAPLLSEDVLTLPRKFSRSACIAIGLAALLHLTAPFATAQTGTAALVGEVSDSQKQVIPGATVTATHVATSASQVTTTDERGSFRLASSIPNRNCSIARPLPPESRTLNPEP